MKAFDYTDCPKRKPTVYLDPKRDWEEVAGYDVERGEGILHIGCQLSLLGVPADGCVYEMIWDDGSGRECPRLTDRFYQVRR